MVLVWLSAIIATVVTRAPIVRIALGPARSKILPVTTAKQAPNKAPRLAAPDIWVRFHWNSSDIGKKKTVKTLRLATELANANPDTAAKTIQL